MVYSFLYASVLIDRFDFVLNVNVYVFSRTLISAASALKPIRISKTRIRVPFEKKESQLTALAAAPPALALIRHATDGMDPLLASAEESPVGGGAAALASAASSPTLGLPAYSAAVGAGSWSAVGGSVSSDREAAAMGASAAAGAGAGMSRGNAPTPQQLAHKVVQGLWAAPTPAEMQLERAATNMAVLDDAVRLSTLDSPRHSFSILSHDAFAHNHREWRPR
jgi:hypothetical protein